MKTLRYVLCDVFTERPLEGNPLAVFTDARGLPAPTMQALARELNLSETVFVLPPERGGHARLRIFTPSRELPFAGHPTLGAAFVMGGPLESDELRFELEVGIVPVRLTREGDRVSFGWMLQPPAQRLEAPDAAPVLAALGVSAAASPPRAYSNGPAHLCIALASARAVAELAPDHSALARATQLGVSVFHFDGSRCTMRYFAPSAGILEDPATGSAAGPVALELVALGKLALGETLRIEQGAELGRPSTLFARVHETGEGLRAEVGGSARVVARGQFAI